MLKNRWYLVFLSILSIALFTGCGDDDGGTGPGPVAGLSSEEQFEAVADALIDYINGDAPAVVTAETLNGDLSSYTVIDIRSSADFAAGRIQGAIHTSLSTLVADVEAGTIPTDKPIVVACYTGQTAGHAIVALRAMGHEAHLLKFGMAAWNTSLANKWNDAVGDGLPPANIETDTNALATEYAWPTLNTGATTAEDAVNARVGTMLSGGFKAVSISQMLTEGLDNYFILNYFGAADYTGTGSSGVPGHIEGAYQFTPKSSLGPTQQLKYLPTDMPIVVYCWTGQTASQVVAYLNMLGYDAYDLKFSSNALWYSSLTGHKWTEAGQSHDYPLVTD